MTRAWNSPKAASFRAAFRYGRRAVPRRCRGRAPGWRGARRLADHRGLDRAGRSRPGIRRRRGSAECRSAVRRHRSARSGRRSRRPQSSLVSANALDTRTAVRHGPDTRPPVVRRTNRARRLRLLTPVPGSLCPKRPAAPSAPSKARALGARTRAVRRARAALCQNAPASSAASVVRSSRPPDAPAPRGLVHA